MWEQDHIISLGTIQGNKERCFCHFEQKTRYFRDYNGFLSFFVILRLGWRVKDKNFVLSKKWMNVNYLTYRNRKEVKKLGPLQIMSKHSNRDNVSTESFYFR